MATDSLDDQQAPLDNAASDATADDFRADDFSAGDIAASLRSDVAAVAADGSLDPTRSARPPRSPRLFLRWVWNLIVDIIDEYQRDGVGDLAAAITFWNLMAIPAVTLALVSTLSSLGEIVGADVAANVEQAIIDFIGATFVNSAPLQGTARDLFDSTSTGVATAAGLVAVWSASGAFAVVVRALDRAYGVRNGRPWWYTRIVAVGLGLATLTAFAFLAATLSVLPPVVGGDFGRYVMMAAAFVVVSVWVTTLFHVAPNQRSPWRFDIPGAIVTTLGWSIAVFGFQGYVRFARGTNQVQSTVGGILVGFTFLYWLSVVMLVGAELNDVLEHRADAMEQNPPIQSRLSHAWSRLRRGFTDGRNDRNDDRRSG